MCHAMLCDMQRTLSFYYATLCDMQRTVRLCIMQRTVRLCDMQPTVRLCIIPCPSFGKRNRCGSGHGSWLARKLDDESVQNMDDELRVLFTITR